MAAEIRRADLQRLALHRVAEEQVLCRNGEWSGSYYLAGLAVEFALKARIARQFKRAVWPDQRFVRDIYTHETHQAGRLGAAEDRVGQRTGLKPELQAALGCRQGLVGRCKVSGVARARGKGYAGCGRSPSSWSVPMDKGAVVKANLEAGRLLLEELEKTGVPVTAAAWIRTADDDHWRFHLASPEVLVRGPLEVYRIIDETLRALPPDRSIDFNDIHVGNPANSFASTVASTLATGDMKEGLLHATDFFVGGEEIKDAWVFRSRHPKDEHPRRTAASPGRRAPGHRRGRH